MSYLVPHQRLQQPTSGHAHHAPGANPGYSQFRRPTVTRIPETSKLERSPATDMYQGKASASAKKEPGKLKKALKYALYGLGAYMLYKLAKVVNPFKAKTPSST